MSESPDSLNLGGDGEREKEGDEETFEFVPSPSLRRWQRRMAALLRRQKERGGVIDLSRKDAVIDETWVRVTQWLHISLSLSLSLSLSPFAAVTV